MNATITVDNNFVQDQRERERVLNDFRNGRVSTLIATDVAARGLGKQPRVFI